MPGSLYRKDGVCLRSLRPYLSPVNRAEMGDDHQHYEQCGRGTNRPCWEVCVGGAVGNTSAEETGTNPESVQRAVPTPLSDAQGDISKVQTWSNLSFA